MDAIWTSACFSASHSLRGTYSLGFEVIGSQPRIINLQNNLRVVNRGSKDLRKGGSTKSETLVRVK